MNMIEKVARAIFKVQFPNSNYDTDTTSIGKTFRLEEAKAAITAMREPTEEMIEVSQCGDVNLSSVYVAMIDAALKE